MQITVDQLRGDLPTRYRERLPKGGFRYLLEQGTHFANAHHRHANTETAVGHATLVTGADPSRHGIVGNDWIDPKTGAFVYNTEDERHHLIGKEPKAHRGVSPRNLLGSTIGDELVLSNAGKSRVFSVSGKDRGAILPGGHAGKAFWYSKSSGEFVTSTYYYDAYPEWVDVWNAAKPVDRYRGSQWQLLQPRENYVAKDLDDRPYEADFWWQTEIGGIMLTPLPGVTKTKPGSATVPFPGIEADLVDRDGNTVKVGGGYLVLKTPWPGMLRTIYGDDARYREQYWSKYPGMYFTGDGAKRDEDGYFWVLGRVDDVLSVAGHRIGTMEVESALVDHHAIAEAAVVGRPHDIKGEVVVGFVILRAGFTDSDELKAELKDHVVKKIGAIARPADVFFTSELPKTRSGKIMRRLLRDIATGSKLGDVTTLADPTVVAGLKQRYEETEG